MNNQDDDVTRSLARSLGTEFHHRADRITEGPISLDAVKTRAGTIRRRRAVTAGVAALAAVAIIAPLGMFAAGALDTADSEPPVATSSPSPSTTDGTSPTPTQAPARPDSPVVIDLDAPQGADPKLDYVDAQTLHRADGSTVELERAYEYVVRAGDEYVAAWPTQSEEGNQIDILDEKGEVVETSNSGSRPVSSADGTVAAWIDIDGVIQTRGNGVTTQMAELDHPAHIPFAISGSGDCRDTEDSQGCAVYFQPNGEGDIPGQVAFSNGEVASPAGELQSVLDVDKDGRLAGTFSSSYADPTVPLISAVFDVRTNTEVVRFDEMAFDMTSAGFSPDGNHVVGRRQSKDPALPSQLEVLDINTGETALEIDTEESLPDEINLLDTHWEDDSHLLVRVNHAGGDVPTYSLFRVGLDGTVESVLEQDYQNGTMTTPWIFVD
ncbi:hypothetical protein BJ980_003049 [Nocardioides daedukensis]|uniref:WD40 repeat domain-containing protein n=1 Tax=Nocardioides daedukensis TaxID=634462 RepID=A0A7Y9S0P0_9ACTN|nr:hypothetical protein [Nocardioides daedukensis]NYG60126.1 hypothetical protein [Nocardioides daedukensis]